MIFQESDFDLVSAIVSSHTAPEKLLVLADA